MMDEYFAVPISPTNKRARAQMDALLEREGIERDRNLTYSAAIYDDDGQMIATGSLFENTLRCLAVDGAHRGEGLMAVIVAFRRSLNAATRTCFCIPKSTAQNSLRRWALLKLRAWTAVSCSWKTAATVSPAI